MTLPSKETKRPTADIGLEWGNCTGVLEHRAKTSGWSLCIGAGTSRGTRGSGVFPSWLTLVEDFINRDAQVPDKKALFETLKATFSSDSLIQAAKDRLGQSDQVFAKSLEEMLYRDLRDKANDSWAQISSCLTATSPAERSYKEWEAFINFFTNEYDNLAALQLARVVSATAGTEVAPSSILSFNVEPLLYALINGVHTVANPKNKLQELRLLNRVTRGISQQIASRIPYIFCHGLLPIDGGNALFQEIASLDKLVFSETEYLQLANNSFSWQSSIFLGTAVLQSMVFVGVSFSDPNLRRWLSWVQANRKDELTLKNVTENSYSHYWINVSPEKEEEKRWIESTVRHLGVRLVWIPKWEETEKHLLRMLNL